MVPLSLAAVLMLGIGVTLRMQMEQPGIETSTSMSSSSAEYPMPASPPPEAAESPKPVERALERVEEKQKRDDAAGARARAPTAQRSDAQANRIARPAETAAPKPEPNPFADGPVVMQQAPSASSPPATTLAIPAPARTEEREMRARESRVLAPPPPAAAPMPAAPPAPAPRQEPPPAFPPQAAAGAADAAAPRAKRESTTGALGAQALRKSAAVPDPDPERELERIARLREAGQHAEADRAIEQFRRDHRDFRIPEAMWERVRPR
jgi:hypothetical protein